MILLPATRVVRQTVERGVLLLPLALCYGYLLARSWQPDTLSLLLPGSLSAGLSGGFNPQFFPSLAGIGQLFSRLITSASLWVHLLAINLFAARQVYLDGAASCWLVTSCTNYPTTCIPPTGLQRAVPAAHSVLLCGVAGPLGLLSHVATRQLWAWRRGF